MHCFSPMSFKKLSNLYNILPLRASSLLRLFVLAATDRLLSAILTKDQALPGSITMFFRLASVEKNLAALWFAQFSGMGAITGVLAFLPLYVEQLGISDPAAQNGGPDFFRHRTAICRHFRHHPIGAPTQIAKAASSC